MQAWNLAPLCEVRVIAYYGSHFPIGTCKGDATVFGVFEYNSMDRSAVSHSSRNLWGKREN